MYTLWVWSHTCPQRHSGKILPASTRQNGSQQSRSLHTASTSAASCLDTWSKQVAWHFTPQNCSRIRNFHFSAVRQKQVRNATNSCTHRFCTKAWVLRGRAAMAIWYRLCHLNGNQLLLVHASEFTPNTYFTVTNSGTRLSSLTLPAPERT